MWSSRINPPIYFMILFLAAIGVSLLIESKILIYPPYSYAGIVLVLLGSIINVWADYLFKSTGTTFKPYAKPVFLNLSGPFRLSRNPIYLGFTMILLGEAVFIGTFLSFIFPLLFMMICQLLYIPAEEKNLEGVFGSDYLDYKCRVRRWL